MSSKYTFKDLTNLVSQLRGQNGCPWDREQTIETLKKYLLEESYEAIDAIEDGDNQSHCEELGDVLLQIIFQSQIAKEEGLFNIEDVINSLCTKLINRHPHVFGQEDISLSSEVENRWQHIKKDEKDFDTHTQELKNIPKDMPALMRGYKVQKKASKQGIDWKDPEAAIENVYEELKELKEAYKSCDTDKTHEEIGDLIFSVVSVSRKLDVEPETALISTIKKFINRFDYVEQNSINKGNNLENMSQDELQNLWYEAKKFV